MEPTDELEKKKLFAAELMRLEDPFKAAFAVFPDSGVAMQMARPWEKDPFVLAECDRLSQGKEAKSFLPSKEKQARDVYAIACDITKITEDRLKAHRLYAELMSYIEKPSAGASVNILNQGVMVVKEAATDADWERKAIEQQRRLIAPQTIEATDASIN